MLVAVNEELRVDDRKWAVDLASQRNRVVGQDSDSLASASRSIWPRLWNEYHLWKVLNDSSTSSNEFFAHLARGHTKLFTNPADKSIHILDFEHITYELRYYLWQLFRYFDHIWCEHRGWRQLKQWTWHDPIKRLINESNLTLISFNYDCLLDSALYYQGDFGLIDKPGRLLFNPRRCCKILEARRPGDVALLKPHGSMMHVPYAGVSFGQNPWLSRITNGKFHALQGRSEYPVRNRCGLPPDLVPPGHNEKHLIDMDTDVVPAIAKALSQCDAFILCGLSANEPDTSEVNRYLSSLRDGTPTWHVDTRGDTVAGELLNKYAPGRYRRLGVNDLAAVPDILS